jgi:hypothetical protein
MESMGDQGNGRTRRDALKVLGVGALAGVVVASAQASDAQAIGETGNLQALRQLTPNAGVVYVNGHTVSGVGDGFFRWSPASMEQDNDGTVVRPTAVQESMAGRWLRILANSDAIDPTWFGCLLDGESDSTVPMQAAFDAAAIAKRKIRIPQGKIRVSQPLFLYGNPCIEGDSPQSSEIIFSNNAGLRFYDAIVSEFSMNQQFEMRHVGLRCSDVRNSGYVLDLRFIGGAGTTAQSVVLEDVEVTGVEGNCGFTRAINLFNARNIKIRGCRISSNASLENWSGISGIYIDGDSQPVEFYITDCNFYHVDAGIYVHGRGAGQGIEGIYISQCSFVSCNYGVFAMSPVIHPLIKVTGSQFNCFNANIFAYNFVHLMICDNVFYAAGPRLQHDHVCVNIGSNQAGEGYTSIIANNVMLGSNFVGAPKNGVVISGSANFNVLVTSNYICGYDTPIWLGAGTIGVTVTATNQLQGNYNNCVQDDGVQNHVSLQKCGL